MTDLYFGKYMMLPKLIRILIIDGCFKQQPIGPTTHSVSS